MDDQDAPDLDVQRARWRRAKREVRARKRRTRLLITQEFAEFAEEVMRERSRRASPESAYWINCHPTLNFDLHDKRKRKGSWLAFLADVWAAQTILGWQYGTDNVSPTKIARWLEHAGLDHGYNASSLRPLLYPALRAINALDGAEPYYQNGRRFWFPFQFTEGHKPLIRFTPKEFPNNAHRRDVACSFDVLAWLC